MRENAFAKKISEEISQVYHEDFTFSKLHIICNVDKTYLETEFDDIVDIAKKALEGFRKKVVTLGATEVLQLYRWGQINETNGTPRSLHFVSGSNLPVRKALEVKLRYENLDCSSDTFRNKALFQSLLKKDTYDRFIGYKTSAILNLIKMLPAGARFFLIGNNARSNIYVYAGLHLFFSKRITLQEYEDYLQGLQLKPEVWRYVSHVLNKLPPVEYGGLFLKHISKYPLPENTAIIDGSIIFQNFLEVAFFFYLKGVFSRDNIWSLIRMFHNDYSISRARLIHLMMELKKIPNLAPEKIVELNMLISKISDNDWPSGPASSDQGIVAFAGHFIQSLTKFFEQQKETTEACHKSLITELTKLAKKAVG